jgi:hypothetical protein
MTEILKPMKIWRTIFTAKWLALQGLMNLRNKEEWLKNLLHPKVKEDLALGWNPLDLIKCLHIDLQVIMLMDWLPLSK